MMNSSLAKVDLFPASGFRGFGPLGFVGLGTAGAGTIFNTFISTTIGVMTVVAFIWFLFTLIIGAYGIMTSGGDKQALESARKKISSGLIGLVLVISAVFIFQLVGYVLGIPNILNPGETVNQISP